jgi:hypothetical protein
LAFRDLAQRLTASPRIFDILPNLFSISRPIIAGNSPLIISGNLLHLEEVHVLPIVQGLQPRVDENTKIKMYAVLAGYSVLERIVKTNPVEYSKLIWAPCNDMPTWIGSLKYTDSFEQLLKIFELTKFGDAAVEGTLRVPALVTLTEILGLYRDHVIKSNLRVSEIGSEIISLPGETKLLDAIGDMFEKRVRRVFVQSDHAQDGATLESISGRDIIRFLFSPDRLEIAKKTPDLWVDATLGEINPSSAKTIHDGKTVNQAASEIGKEFDSCLVCEPSLKVVTRWDLVMKPYQKKDYAFA